MGGWTVFRIRGIPVRVHVTLLIAVPYFALLIAMRFLQAAEVAEVDPARMVLPPFLWGLLLAIGLFVCVGLHELGHALLAKRAKKNVKSITLMLLGGVSEIEGDDADHEASISAVGPLVSFALAALFFAAHNLAGAFPDVRFGLFYMAQINLTIGIFNLLPAFPLDGGRVLRALIAKRAGPEKATSIAVSIGKVFAILLGLLGLLSVNLILILISLFIYVAGTREAQMAGLRKTLEGLTAADVMRPVSESVGPAESVAEVLRKLAGRHEFFLPVLGTGRRLLGLAELRALLSVPERQRTMIPVEVAMNRRLSHVRPRDPAMAVVEALVRGGPAVAVVDEQGVLEGLVDQEDIAKSLHLRKMIDTRRAA